MLIGYLAHTVWDWLRGHGWHWMPAEIDPDSAFDEVFPH
jgi:hypothetical protein